MVQNARNVVLETVKLNAASVSAVNHRGASVPLEVLAEDFQQIKITTSLEVPRPSP